MTNISTLATFGGGCFWCLEAVFQDLTGVGSVISGYAGGTTAYPTYEQVCTGETGHAEVVHIRFDPEVISFEELLQVFWHIHDPTSLNKQGADVGTQYRSVILYHNDEQKAQAERSKQKYESSGEWSRPFVTEIAPFEDFCPAEECHQNYFARNPSHSYCRVVIAPKVTKFRKSFQAQLKSAANDSLLPNNGETQKAVVL